MPVIITKGEGLGGHLLLSGHWSDSPPNNYWKNDIFNKDDILVLFLKIFYILCSIFNVLHVHAAEAMNNERGG